MLSLFKRAPANPGLIWLDDGKAHRSVDAKRKRGEVTDAEAENLHKYADDGYFIIKVDLTADDAKAFDADVDRLWRERPRNVAYAYEAGPHRFSDADEATQRKPRSRVHDLHSASALAKRLYLDPVLARYASLILGEPAVATQSLYFEFGSQQPLHRDSIVVPTPQFGRLLASWFALEDIDPRSGALAYVPGSQKLPFYEFRPGRYVYDPTIMTAADVEAAMRFYDEQLRKSRLETKLFLAKRGEVLLWHSALLHGGGPVTDERLTRKSFVVHYSTLAGHPLRDVAVHETIDGTPGESVFQTKRLLTRDGAYGFENPLDGELAYRR
ncbi:MAG: Phytanoyl-CoA dioxygenase [Acidobacteria bacterium]|nr:Phytanoyl-CoA dioxygenase [Acidobacteriota bacterium]